MRIKLNRENPFPRKVDPSTRGLLLEKDIAPFQFSKLRAKLLLFDTARNMRSFWKRAIGQPIPHSVGVVSRLSFSEWVFDGKGGERYAYEVYDPRYFCVIGLCESHLTVEILMHESVHAGFAWAKRKQRSPWDAHAVELDEEAVCYPAGYIAEAILCALQKAGFCLNE